MHELASMAKALDIQKGLAEGAHFLHGEVTRRKEHDAEVNLLSYLSVYICYLIVLILLNKNWFIFNLLS